MPITLETLGLTDERKPALRSAWRAFWMSRLLVWVAAVAGVFGLGTEAFRENNPGAEDPGDSLSGVLLSPAERWDSGWYLAIADRGYDTLDISATAFFPVYPLLVRFVGGPLSSLQLAGVVVSGAAFMAALYLLHRLTELEAGRDAADRAVSLLAFFPMSFYFSAIYTESLFLALTVGCLYSARRGWFVRAAILGALASATRPTGVLLLVPLLIFMMSRPRQENAGSQTGRRVWTGYRPRGRDVAVLVSIPAGLLGYLAYVGAATRYGVLSPFKAQAEWAREFRGPLVGVWGGVKNAGWGAREILSGARLNVPVPNVLTSLLDFGALAFASIGVAGAFRRLPPAYGAYALAGLLFGISFPAESLMMKSLPRFIVVLFPAFMWLGIVIHRSRTQAVALGASAAGLGVFSALFASGYWIA